VALKVLNASMDALREKEEVMQELNAQYHLRSSYVVRCRGFTDTTALGSSGSLNGSVIGSGDANKFVIVMDYMDGGPLSKLLAHPDYRTLSSSGRVWLALQVASAIKALSIENIVHGDIKPLNFLWGLGGNDTRALVKVSDFGNSKLHATMQSMTLASAVRTSSTTSSSQQSTRKIISSQT